MIVTIKEEERDRITNKSSDGTCTFKIDDQEYDGLIIGMSTRGTLTIQTLDEVGTISDEEKKRIKTDQVQQVEEDFIR